MQRYHLTEKSQYQPIFSVFVVFLLLFCINVYAYQNHSFIYFITLLASVFLSSTEQAFSGESIYFRYLTKKSLQLSATRIYNDGECNHARCDVLILYSKGKNLVLPH